MYIVELIYRSGLQAGSKLKLRSCFLWRTLLCANALCTLVKSLLTHLWIKYFLFVCQGGWGCCLEFIFDCGISPQISSALPYKANTLGFMETQPKLWMWTLKKCLKKYSQHTLNGPGLEPLEDCFSKVIIYSHFKLLNVNKSLYCFLKLLLSCHAESVPFPYVLFFILGIWWKDLTQCIKFWQNKCSGNQFWPVLSSFLFHQHLLCCRSCFL